MCRVRGEWKTSDGEDARLWSLDGLLVQTCVVVAVAVTAFVATSLTGGALSVVFGVITLVTGLYGAYLLCLLAAPFVFIWFFENVLHVGMEGRRPATRRASARLPRFIWVGVPVLAALWAVGAWLYGYDAAQWLSTGVSFAAGTVIVVVAFARPRRGAAPDGPGHRRRPER